MIVEVEQIPEIILNKHPEMLAIGQAISEHNASQPVTARCLTCGHRLVVTDYPELGSLWVSCEDSCTNFHMKYEPKDKSVAA